MNRHRLATAAAVLGLLGPLTTSAWAHPHHRAAPPGRLTRVPSPSLLTDVHVVDAHGQPVLPVQWSDDDVSLWPGESVTLTATYRTADLHGSAPSVRVSGWNTPERTVPAQ